MHEAKQWLSSTVSYSTPLTHEKKAYRGFAQCTIAARAAFSQHWMGRLFAETSFIPTNPPDISYGTALISKFKLKLDNLKPLANLRAQIGASDMCFAKQ